MEGWQTDGSLNMSAGTRRAKKARHGMKSEQTFEQACVRVCVGALALSVTRCVRPPVCSVISCKMAFRVASPYRIRRKGRTNAVAVIAASQKAHP